MKRGKVTKVIDGDTFKVANGPYIRLDSVDTPEKGTKGFTKSKNELKDLIQGENIKYEGVGKSYGRVVAKVWVNSKSVNSTMKKKGYNA